MTKKIPYKYIAIEGNIGAGKSTLANMLHMMLGGVLVLEEFEDNPFLPKFYEDKRRYAFPLETSFLTARYNQMKREVLESQLFNPYIISDYTFAKCRLFSRINLEDDEYALYERLYNIMIQQIRQPDLLLYLHAPVEKLKWNISNRGRSYESNIDETYLLNLQEAYFEYLRQNSQLKVVILDCSPINFVENPADFNYITNLLTMEYRNGINHVKPTQQTTLQHD